MIVKKGTRYWGVLVIPLILFVCQAAYLLPIFQQTICWWGIPICSPPPANPLWKLSDANVPFVRTLAFSFATALLQVVIGFFGAVLLKQSVRTRLLGLLLIPAFLGSTIVSFIFKPLPIYLTVLGSRPTFITWLVLVLIETWQYGSMCLYLFWLRLQFLPRRLEEFAFISRLTYFEYIKHIVWPYCRNLAAVLVLLACLNGFQEYSKSSIILGASRGTNTEFVSHWIDRNHRQIKKDFSENARGLGLAYSGLLLVAILSLAGIIVFLVKKIIAGSVSGLNSLDSLTRNRQRPKLPSSVLNSARRTKVVKLFFFISGMLVFLFMVLPLCLPFPQLKEEVVTRSASHMIQNLKESFGLFGYSSLLAIPPTLILSVLTILFGVTVRIILPRHTESFNRRSLVVFYTVLLVHAVPGIGLAYCAFYWLSVSPSNLEPAMYLFWLVSQSVIGFSLVGAFILYVHFDVASNELFFSRVSGASLLEIAWYSFIRRFWLSYVLLVLFSFALIINEATVSSVLSDYVTTVMPELHKKASGPSADYLYAASIVAPVLVVVMCGICIWNWLLRRALSEAKK